MRTYLSLPYTHEDELPPGHDDEFRTPDELVARFLREYTAPGDAVIDVFAGYGTTLAVAERLDRVPYGLEYEPERVALVRDRIDTPEHVREGDVLDLEPDWFPACACCFTSPPFMTASMELNPFRNYEGEREYDAYLDDIEAAFAGVDGVLEPGGHVVVDVSNMKHRGEVTPLAWDVAARVANVFHFEGEVVVTWERGESQNPREGLFGYGYDHTYCLVFSKPVE